MICPDCHSKSFSFQDYCPKCGASLRKGRLKQNVKNLLAFLELNI